MKTARSLLIVKATLMLLVRPTTVGAFLQVPIRASSRLSSVSPIISTSCLYASQPRTADFSTLTVVELKGLLRDKGVKVSGRKTELIKRLSSLAEQTEYTDDDAAALEAAIKKPRKKKSAVASTRNIARKSVPTSTNRNEDPSLVTSNTGIRFSDINGVPSRLLKRLVEMGMETPTPIQQQAIPTAIQGKDVMGLAQTGTGKTLAFGVPLVSQMMANEQQSRPKSRSVRGLIMAPTRELANQIAVQLRVLTENTPITTFVVVGGQNINTQINKLKGGVDILVATPGRLIDLTDRGALTLHYTTFLVLDEADQMLDMGFLPSLRKVVKMLPPKRQTMLFSATMSENMNEVARSYLTNPVRVQVAPSGKTADKVTQELHYVAKPDKTKKLVSLLRNHKEERSIVFGRTKHGMEKLSKKLIAYNFKAVSIHGNKSQNQRDNAIKAFKSGAVKVLVATDVAARGLDIPDVKHVYNYELPNVPEAYVHRIGRTARAGKEGAAIAFCSMEEMDDLLDIQKVLGVTIPVMSGRPWSRMDTNRAKTAIKDRKKEQQAARRSVSNKPKRTTFAHGNARRRR